MGQSQGDKYALLELAHLPPEMNKEEFARAWTQIVKRYQPATEPYHNSVLLTRTQPIGTCHARTGNTWLRARPQSTTARYDRLWRFSS